LGGPEPHFIEDEEVIEKILKHPGPGTLRFDLASRAKGASVMVYIDDSDSRILSPDFFCVHPDTRWILM
jgi:hypothetical protein